MMTQDEFDSVMQLWCLPDPLPVIDLIGDIERKLAIEEHRQGLEYGLSADHCGRCQKRYVQLNCPHSDTTTIQTLEDPIPHVYCATCGEPRPAPW